VKLDSSNGRVASEPQPPHTDSAHASRAEQKQPESLGTASDSSSDEVATSAHREPQPRLKTAARQQERSETADDPLAAAREPAVSTAVTRKSPSAPHETRATNSSSLLEQTNSETRSSKASAAKAKAEKVESAPPLPNLTSSSPLLQHIAAAVAADKAKSKIRPGSARH
jgi:hypothetical protein